MPTTPIYAASKAALTSLTEVLHFQLSKASAKVKAAVMYPGPHVINSNILNSAHARPERFVHDQANKPKQYTSFKDLAEASGVEFALTEPEEVAAYTIEQIKQGKFWIMPPEGYDETLAKLKARTDSMVQGTIPVYPE